MKQLYPISHGNPGSGLEILLYIRSHLRMLRVPYRRHRYCGAARDFAEQPGARVVSLHRQMFARISHNRIGESDAVDHGAFNRSGDAEGVDGAREFDHLRDLVSDVWLVSHTVVLRDKRCGADEKLELTVVRSQATVAVYGWAIFGYRPPAFIVAVQRE